MKLLGLWEHRGKVPSQLSGGQQQRTAIGRAVVKNPDILLCDELTGPEYMEVIRRVKDARDAEHSYNNFSGILDGQKGSIRFVIETEEIEADF